MPAKLGRWGETSLKTRLLILAFCLSGCAARQQTAKMPCGATLLVPKGCFAKSVQDGVEIHCPGAAVNNWNFVCGARMVK